MSSSTSTPPTRADFDAQLAAILDAARAEQRPFVDVVARDLHRAVGGYPAPDGQHRMPMAVGAMRALAKTMPSEILYSPRSGQGPSLTIRYHLAPSGA